MFECVLCVLPSGTSPYQVHQDSIPEDGALLTVVAVEDRNSVAMGMLHLEKPVPISPGRWREERGERDGRREERGRGMGGGRERGRGITILEWWPFYYAKQVTKPHLPPSLHTGPVKIIILGVEPPDALGRIFIHFRTSRLDVNCLCRTNVSHFHCTTVFKADPQMLGSGPHNLTIVCMDSDAYSATQNLKVILPRPPPLSKCVCLVSMYGARNKWLVINWSFFFSP